MDYHVTGVEKNPVAVGLAFRGDGNEPRRFYLFPEVVGHGAYLASGAAVGDDHEIGNVGFTVEIDDNHVFGFVVIKGTPNQRK